MSALHLITCESMIVGFFVFFTWQLAPKHTNSHHVCVCALSVPSICALYGYVNVVRHFCLKFCTHLCFFCVSMLTMTCTRCLGSTLCCYCSHKLNLCFVYELNYTWSFCKDTDVCVCVGNCVKLSEKFSFADSLWWALEMKDMEVFVFLKNPEIEILTLR